MKVQLNIYTHYDNDDNNNGDFDVFQPHGARQTSTRLLECHRLQKHWRKSKFANPSGKC